MAVVALTYVLALAACGPYRGRAEEFPNLDDAFGRVSGESGKH